MSSQDQAIVVEGYMDFLSLYSRGFKNTVATLGNGLNFGSRSGSKKIHSKCNFTF